MHKRAVVVHLQRAGVEMQLLANQFIQSMFDESDRHFVDREFFVNFFNHGLLFHVAEERDLVGVFATDRPFGADDQNVRLNADFAKLLHAVLRWFRLGFPRGFQIRHQRQVNEHDVFFADVERNLANGFQKRQTLDVANRATEFRDDDIDVRSCQTQNAGFDFVGDMRHNLHGVAEIFASAFFFDH